MENAISREEIAFIAMFSSNTDSDVTMLNYVKAILLNKQCYKDNK
jgi:hypothetical protein